LESDQPQQHGLFQSAGRQDVSAWDEPDSNWNRAAAAGSQADPFCCRTEWQLSYHEAMDPHRKLIVREQSGSIAAFAEMNLPESSAGSLSIYSPVESHWFFGSPVLGPAGVDLLVELFDELVPSRDDYDSGFLVSGVEPDGPLFKEIAGKLGSFCNAWKVQEETLCSASLEGGVDGFLSRRSAKHRRSLRKQNNKASKAGVYFERHAPATAADAAAVYARMLAVEESSWKGIGECGMTVGRSRRYYDCMTRRLAESRGGRIMFARHEEKDIGFVFGGLAGSAAGSCYRGQQFSYADDWKNYSIGNLLQLEQIKWLCEEGVDRYDMGPMMDYKVHWTEINTSIMTLMLKRKPAAI